ncbi:hypothetical protein ACFQ0T_19360 [Kitasatospora gansuensis]
MDVPALRVPAYHYRERPVFPVTTPEPNPSPAVQPAPVRILPVGPTRQEVAAAAVERERRAHHIPAAVEPKSEPTSEVEPEPVKVVPLWERDEERQRVERRRTLAVVSNELPDPGYTYEGAHCLAGAVA